MNTNYEKYKEVIKTTNVARRAALSRLAKLHEEEFRVLYVEEAKARGLNPTKTERMQKKADVAAAIEVEEQAFFALVGDSE